MDVLDQLNGETPSPSLIIKHNPHWFDLNEQVIKPLAEKRRAIAAPHAGYTLCIVLLTEVHWLMVI